jgi:hypothetical protein
MPSEIRTDSRAEAGLDGGCADDGLPGRTARDGLSELLLAMKAIRYPHRDYLCDEETDPVLREVCEALDITST